MLLAPDQRRLLGAFLRAHREALNPTAAGTPASRRRTPGLRREEVAQQAGISTTWYTWLEQGRDIALSASALARLADALQLNAAERTYLFELTRRRDPTPRNVEAPVSAVPPELDTTLRSVTMPAYLLDPLWRARGWNAPGGRLFAPWFDSGEPCLLRFVFLVPAARQFIWDWEDRARRLLAEFRADTARDPDDAAMHTLVEDLRRDSTDFARMWQEHAVLAREGGTRRFNHPLDGSVEYQQVTLIPAAHPGWKLVLLLSEAPQG